MTHAAIDRERRLRHRAGPSGAIGRLLFALLGLLATGGSGAADAAVLCRRPSGRLHLAASCSRRETPVSAADLGLVGAVGADGTPGATGETGLLPYQVIDAQGRPVGAVLSYIGDFVYVVLSHESLPQPVQLLIQGGQIQPDVFGGSVLYENTDCTGTPFIRSGGSPVPRAERVGNTLYVAPEAPVEEEFASFENEDVDDCSDGTITSRGTCCRARVPSPSYGAAADAVALTTLGITEPLTLESRP